jgi:hypothetical protein
VRGYRPVFRLTNKVGTEPMTKRRSLFIQQDDGRPILLDYYDGAYGKTLRIDLQSLESLGAFSLSLDAFYKGTASEASLRSIGEVVLVPPLVDVRLVRSGSESISASEAATGTVIGWSNDKDGWETVIELLGPLTVSGRKGKSGHQYLTRPGASILVELALFE